MSEQFVQQNLFGPIVDDFLADGPLTGGGNPCIEAFGVGPDGKNCKDCKKFFKKVAGERSYYKCRLRGNTNGAGTDHRLKYPACGMFKEDPCSGAK